MKNEWVKVPIKDVTIGIYDGLHATPKPADSGPIFLGIKNITSNGKLDLSDVRHIAEEDFPKWTKRIQPQAGDIVFSYEATLNLYAVIPNGFRGCLGRRLALIKTNPELIDYQYLFYYFFSEEWRNTISQNIISGSTVERIPLIRFPNFEISLPPLLVQHKIATALSAYDTLIEINDRRIKLLEEMAQLIYREWFVNFRFPGHDNVKMVESEMGLIPEGWSVIPFTQICEVLSGGTPKTSIPEYWNGKIPFFTTADAPNNFFVYETEKTITELGLSRCNSKLYPSNTVFITSRGTVGKVVLNSVDMAMSQSCYALRGKSNIPQYYVFFMTRNYVDQLKQNAIGAVFDTIVINTFEKLKIVNPPIELAKEFSVKIAPIMELILSLHLKNDYLRQARDLLLPRLISGEIDVSELNIRVSSEDEAL